MKTIKLLLAAAVLTLNFPLQTLNCSAQSATSVWAVTSPSPATQAKAMAISGPYIYVAGNSGSSSTTWYIEKRDTATGALVTAFGTSGAVTGSVGDPGIQANAITVNSSGIYVAGGGTISASDGKWMIEKRDLTTGALITGFGTSGVLTINPSSLGTGDYVEKAFGITADASGIYVVGQEYLTVTTPIDTRWRIEKRDLTTGALITGFGAGGVVTFDPGQADYPMAIAVDGTGIYVAGTTNVVSGSSAANWVIRKYNQTSGAFNWTVSTSPVCGGGANQPRAILVNSSGVYVAGTDDCGGGEWRIEKRDLGSGALVPGFGTSGVIIDNLSAADDEVHAMTADATGIYAIGCDDVVASTNKEWRMQKRDLTTGALLCTYVINPAPGIFTFEDAFSTTISGGGVYLGGYGSLWRVEKVTTCQPLTTTSSATNINCKGQCTGTATAAPANGTPPYLYNWTGGQTTQIATGLCVGNYTVTITDAASATTSATVTITEPAMALSATASSTATTCSSNNGTATAIPNGGTAGYSYSWNSSPAQSTPTATGLAAGNYTVTVTDANGCTTTQTTTVANSNGPIATLSQTNILCNGQCTGSSIATATNGTAPYTYSWSNGQTTANATALCAAPYTVTVTDSNTCITTATLTITQPPPIPITVTATPTTITAGSTSQLTATGGGTYQWSPSTALNCDTCSNPIATPTVTTTYSVTVTNASGCTATAFVPITVDIICGELFVPNAFSPNNDGANELECVFSNPNCITDLHFAIYDRWGEKVFETTNPNDVCWDGKYKGILMNTAVFVYYLRATLVNGEKLKKEGNITLIR